MLEISRKFKVGVLVATVLASTSLFSMCQNLLKPIHIPNRRNSYETSQNYQLQKDLFDNIVPALANGECPEGASYLIDGTCRLPSGDYGIVATREIVKVN